MDIIGIIIITICTIILGCMADYYKTEAATELGMRKRMQDSREYTYWILVQLFRETIADDCTFFIDKYPVQCQIRNAMIALGYTPYTDESLVELNKRSQTPQDTTPEPTEESDDES